MKLSLTSSQGISIQLDIPAEIMAEMMPMPDDFITDARIVELGRKAGVVEHRADGSFSMTREQFVKAVRSTAATLLISTTEPKQ